MDGSWRSTHPYNSENKIAVELYDYQKDPDETINVVSDPEYEPVLQDLHQKLLQYFAAQTKK